MRIRTMLIGGFALWFAWKFAAYTRRVPQLQNPTGARTNEGFTW